MVNELFMRSIGVCVKSGIGSGSKHRAGKKNYHHDPTPQSSVITTDFQKRWAPKYFLLEMASHIFLCIGKVQMIQKTTF